MEVNKDFIAYICNDKESAKYCEHEVIDYGFKIEELKQYIKGNHRSISQIRLKYRELFPIKFWWQGYCLDNEYNDVEYAVISDPTHVFIELQDKLTYERYRISSRYKSYNDRKRELRSIERQLVDEYSERFLHAVEKAKAAINYEMTLRHIKDNENIVAYSSDQKGWSNFNFLKINDDIGIKVKTNFCYGRSSFFIVTILYKNIPIVPYSYIVTYYNARSVDVIRGTRWFNRRRSSWKPALKFAVELANSIRSNPQFINGYLSSELDELVCKMEALLNEPSTTVFKFEDHQSNEISLSYICDLNIESMLIEQDELPIAVAALKVTDALDYISSLKQLSVDFNHLSIYIDKIYKFNSEIKSRIIKLKNKVSDTLTAFSAVCAKIKSEMDSLDEVIKSYDDDIQLKLSLTKQICDRNKVRTSYIEANPKYKVMLSKKNALNDDLKYAKDRLSKRKLLSDKLDSLLDKICKSLPKEYN